MFIKENEWARHPSLFFPLRGNAKHSIIKDDNRKWGFFMKKYCIFGVACLSVLAIEGVAIAGRSQSCSLGTYSKSNDCKPCPSNCYCTAHQKANDNEYHNVNSEIYCENGELWRTQYDNNCKKGMGCTSYQGYVYACPKDFPLSDNGAKSSESCYASCGGTRLPYKKIHCDEGYFLHYKTKECYKCEGRDNDPSLSKQAICTGGDFYPTCGMENQGIKICDSQSVPNKERTKCVSTDCPEGQRFDTTAAKCVDLKIVTVKPGYYLPKGYGSKQTACSNTARYCPGGDFLESDSDDQGFFKCPNGTTANSKYTACSKSIKDTEMIYGPKGSGTPTEFQCWMYFNDPAKYKTCVLSNPYYK